MNTQKIGERLKMLRKNANLSADELAKLIGKDRATIYRYEKGDIQKLPFELLEPLARAFGITPADIVGISEENLILSQSEKRLILAYRKQPEMQTAVNRLLEISEEKPPQIVQTVTTMQKTARTTDGTFKQETITDKSKIEKVKNLTEESKF